MTATTTFTIPNASIPFSSLPLDPTGPPGNAWGRFGPDDQLGTLNLLTPAAVAAAARSEIRTGVRISLDWPLDKPALPGNGREPMKHEIRRRGHAGRVVNDDVITFNTQCSSQWDGLRHYGYLEERKYYNNTDPDQISSSNTLGIDAISTSGGILGRGVLLDYVRFAHLHSIPLSPLTSNPIPLSHLLSLIASQNMTFHPGDILFIRSGFTSAYNSLSTPEQVDLAARPAVEYAGVEANLEVAKWIWESGFAAVAGDAVSWECAPLGKRRGEGERAVSTLHEWLIAGWGMPIGEMFDLEELASHCERERRWSFFLSSVPLKFPTLSTLNAEIRPPEPPWFKTTFKLSYKEEKEADSPYKHHARN